MGLYITIGVLLALLFFAIAYRVNHTAVKNISNKCETILCPITIVVINYSFLLLYCLVSILQLIGPFTEIVCACLIIASWILSGRCVKLIDTDNRMKCSEKCFAFLFSVITAVVVSIFLSRSEHYGELIRISGMSTAVFLGTFISIDSFFGEESPQLFLESIQMVLDKFKCSTVCKLTCFITSIVIILISVLGNRVSSVSQAFFGVGAGIPVGAILVVVVFRLIDVIKNDRESTEPR